MGGEGGGNGEFDGSSGGIGGSVAVVGGASGGLPGMEDCLDEFVKDFHKLEAETARRKRQCLAKKPSSQALAWLAREKIWSTPGARARTGA
ncbi:unnamed protein product, partial [Discosporangium mesarthrocarpum]